MRIKIIPYDPEREEKPVLPRIGNYRRQDLTFLRTLMLLLVLLAIVLVPLELHSMHDIHEKTGVLQGVTEEYHHHRHRRRLAGLNLTIDGKIYYLDGDFIFNDGSKHAVTGILPMGNALRKSAYMNHPITIQHTNDGKIIGAASGDEVWLDSEISLMLWENGIHKYAKICLAVFLGLLALYLFRKHCTIIIQK